MGDRTDPDPQIDMLLRQVEHVVGKQEPDFDVFVASHEGVDDGQNVQPPEQGWRRQGQKPLDLLILATRLSFGIADIFENTQHVLVVALSRFGDRHPPGRPV